MNPRPAPAVARQAPRWRTPVPLLLLPALLVALALPLLVAGRAAAVPQAFCMPSEGTGCLFGKVSTGEDVVEGVDITVTGPGDGGDVDETVTTDENGAWQVLDLAPGTYEVTVEEDSLPDGIAINGRATKVFQVAPNVPRAATLDVRTVDYKATTGRGELFAQSTVNGIQLGLLLALASVGLSLIYGTMGLSNFAHAEQVTLGGILGWALVNNFGLGLWLGGFLTVVFCAFTGWFQDRVMWQPLRRRGLGLTQMMIVTIGLSLAMQYSFQFFAGARTVRVLQDQPEVVEIGSVTITTQSIAAMSISVVVLVIIGFVLLRTRIGRATRAVSDNPALAAASGIDVDKVIRLVWTVAMGLAGLSGIMYALVVNGIKWDSGLQILLLLFAAVTLGGLGTAFGALVGAIIIGLVVELSPAIGIPGDFKYAAALTILIVLLVFRPQGLLGRAQRVG